MNRVFKATEKINKYGKVAGSALAVNVKSTVRSAPTKVSAGVKKASSSIPRVPHVNQNNAETGVRTTAPAAVKSQSRAKRKM